MSYCDWLYRNTKLHEMFVRQCKIRRAVQNGLKIMNSVFKKFNKIIPTYSIIPLLSVVLVNYIVYYCTRPLTQQMIHHSMLTAVDMLIPFVPEFIIIYWIAYVQWCVGYIVLSRDSRQLCYSILSAEIAAKLICMVVFIIYPTTMQRADITGTDFFSMLTKLTYSCDAPDNLFPSIHCMESWLCFRGTTKMKHKHKELFCVLSFIFALLVFASTLFVKQHVFLDIFGGVAAAELGLLIARHTKASRVFDKINSSLCKMITKKG